MCGSMSYICVDVIPVRTTTPGFLRVLCGFTPQMVEVFVAALLQDDLPWERNSILNFSSVILFFKILFIYF